MSTVNAKKTATPSLPADAAALDTLIDAAAAMNGLTIDPAYRESVKINLHAIANAAKPVLAFNVADDAEPAPVFRP